MSVGLSHQSPSYRATYKDKVIRRQGTKGGAGCRQASTPANIGLFISIMRQLLVVVEPDYSAHTAFPSLGLHRRPAHKELSVVTHSIKQAGALTRRHSHCSELSTKVSFNTLVFLYTKVCGVRSPLG